MTPELIDLVQWVVAWVIGSLLGVAVISLAFVLAQWMIEEGQ